MFFKIFLIFVLFSSVFSHEDHDHDHDHNHEEDPNSAVHILNDDEFESTLEKNEFVFVKFYAPWCGHCIRLAPEYEKVAQHFKDSKILIAKIDATENPTSAGKYQIRGYPTLKFFRNGKAFEYESGRTAEDIIKWISKKSSPASTELKTQEEINEFLEKPETKILAYIESENLPKYLEIANQFDDFLFSHVVESSLISEKIGQITLSKEGENFIFQGELEALPEFLTAEAYPLVEELAQKIWMRSSASQTPLLAVFVSEVNEENLNFVKNIAGKFKGKVLSSYSNAASLAERWGTSGTVFPTAVLVNWLGEEPKLTVYDEESGVLTEEAAVSFIEKSLLGEYRSFRKSQPIPEPNNEPVTVLVGKNFEEIVFDPEKDVFVEFYAPWCGHCKNLAPVWDELATFFSETKTLIIAKIDATANSYPENIEVRGFPTLYFFPADNKSPVPYVGDRDLESLKAFVKENASRSVGKEEL